MESFYDPIAQAEVLFSDYDNLTIMQEDKLAHVRLGQIPLLSHEYGIDEDLSLSEKENFQLRKGAGEVYALGGRLFGKTLFVEKVDLLLSMFLLGAEKVGFSSYDAIHIRGVLEDIIPVLEHHPLFTILDAQISRSPSYRIYLRSGYTLEGINMNLMGKAPGRQFFQKHLTRLFIEEASFETEEVYRQRRDSVSENGCVFRISGMTNFTRYSPCGKIFYDMSQRGKVVNLPQYVNPKWDFAMKEQAIKDFNGETSMGYRVFIRGEIVEDGVSVFDMERVRKNYDEDRVIKIFEVNKEVYAFFRSFIIVERPGNASETYIFADIGESAPTEIGVIFKINNKYRYVYNIVLRGLTDKEQFLVFQWLATRLEANYISVDTTDGTGRAIFRQLSEVFPNKNLVACTFTEKISVDFDKDENGNFIFKEGKPVFKEEYVSEWSIKHLKDLLYSDVMDMPIDYKLDQQLNSVVSMQSGARTVYDCVAQENHLFQAFQVFSICHWHKEFSLLKPITRKSFCKSGV